MRRAAQNRRQKGWRRLLEVQKVKARHGRGEGGQSSTPCKFFQSEEGCKKGKLQATMMQSMVKLMEGMQTMQAQILDVRRKKDVEVVKQCTRVEPCPGRRPKALLDVWLDRPFGSSV